MTSHQGRSAIRDPDANYAFRKDTYHLLGQGSKISDQHPSQQTGVDGHEVTRRTKRPTNPDRSEDPQTIYHGEKNGSRTETKFPVSYEPCSSVPQKSKKQKHVPSIIHDGVTRGQITGAETHRQAIDFSWNELMEVPKRQKRSQPPPKTTFVNGYPNPEYLGVHEEDVGKEDDDLQHTEDNDDDYAYSGDDEFDDYEAEDEQKWFDDEDVYDDDYEDEENDVNAKVVKREKVLEGVTLKACSEIRVIQTLPHIGYSPSPSRERLTPLSQRSNTSFLPPLPESPYMATQSYLCVTDTNGTRGTTKSHKGKFRMKKVINSVRRFHGRMYDPGTLASNKVVTYDITPAFRANMDTWDAQIKDGAPNSGNRLSRRLQQETRRSTMVPSRRSVKPEIRHQKIPEECDEDAYYEQTYSDDDSCEEY